MKSKFIGKAEGREVEIDWGVCHEDCPFYDKPYFCYICDRKFMDKEQWEKTIRRSVIYVYRFPKPKDGQDANSYLRKMQDALYSICRRIYMTEEFVTVIPCTISRCARCKTDRSLEFRDDGLRNKPHRCIKLSNIRSVVHCWNYYGLKHELFSNKKRRGIVIAVRRRKAKVGVGLLLGSQDA